MARTCSRCGAPLGSDRLVGLCLECMLTAALGPESPAEPPLHQDESPVTESLPGPPLLARFGDYELLEELAHGGMGVVYKARQVKLDRLVVVKMLLLGQRASDEVVERFKREAQAAAHLRHPNIVTIHEVGEVQGQPFFSMDFVPGQDLARMLRDRPLPAREAATYLQPVAAAIHYAHTQGVIHRDIKPSNLLVDYATNEVRVTDFGLAKRLDDDSDLTLSGQVLGSPNHMAPELASGNHRQAGPASDVFSLGAVLYEMLTGRPPFLADSLQATLLKIRDADPVAPRELNSGIPRDLETICLKCLEKDPRARFASAQELADELGRFLRGEPILTRPAGVMEKAWRWCQRKPALAGLAGSILLLALVSTGAAIALGVARQQQQREQYYAEIGLAHQHISEGDIDRALDRLMRCPPRYRHWEWGHLLYLCHQELRTLPAHTNVYPTEDLRISDRITPVLSLSFSPDSQSLVTLGSDRIAKIWAVADGRLRYTCGEPDRPVNALAWRPDGQELALGENDLVTVRQAHTGKLRAQWGPFSYGITQLAWRPDGRQLAVGLADNSIELHNSESGDRTLRIPGRPPPVTALFYTPDGLKLVRLDRQRCAALDPVSGSELEALAIDHTRSLVMVPDPRMERFVEWGRHSEIVLWEGGVRVSELDRLVGRNMGQAPVVFSPDGARFVTRSEAGTARVWDAQTHRPLFAVPSRVYTAVFSPDGRRLATAGNTSEAHVWDIENSRELRALRGHRDLVELVAFSPNGLLVATAARDGEVKLWSATDGREVVVYPTVPWPAAISPDGRRFCAGLASDGVTVRESASGKALLKLSVEGDTMLAACFSPDGTRLLTGSHWRKPSVWDLEAGQRLFTLEGHTRAISLGLAFSPDGKMLSTCSYDGTAKIWDARDGRLLHTFPGNSSFDAATFSPDSRFFAALMRIHSAEIGLWDLETGRLFRRLEAHMGETVALIFHPDGTQLVTSGTDNRIRFWDIRSGALRKELPLRGYAAMLRFSPDGRRLFCSTQKLSVAGQDRPALEIWDTESGRLTLTLKEHQDVHNKLDISADGRQLLSAGFEGQVRQWQVFPWQEREYPATAGLSFTERVRQYAESYWRQRLAAESAAGDRDTPLREVRIPFDRSMLAPRDPSTPAELLDLTAHYTAPLDRSVYPAFGDDVDNDLRSLPAGVGQYGGVAFDVRGTISLRVFGREGKLFQVALNQYPDRVEGIRVGRQVQRLHIFHGVFWGELDETEIASVVWHYADGQQRQSVVKYGRHARTWWEATDPRPPPPDARVAWEGSNLAASELPATMPSAVPGRELRLYTAAWENPRPGVEVTHLDLVSRESECGFFVLAMTVE